MLPPLSRPLLCSATWIVVDMETDIATTNPLAALGAAGDLGAVMDVLEGNLAPAQFDQASAIHQDMTEQLRRSIERPICADGHG